MIALLAGLWIASASAAAAEPGIVGLREETVLLAPDPDPERPKDILATRKDGRRYRLRPGVGCRAFLTPYIDRHTPDPYYGWAVIRSSVGDPFADVPIDDYDRGGVHLVLQPGDDEPAQCRVLRIEPLREKPR